MTKIALSGALFGLISLSAQDQTVEVKARLEKQLDEAKATGFAFAQMVGGKTVKGSPYSAQAVNETTQALADGNRISRTTSSMIYRDSEGRERREESMSIGNSSAADHKTIFISDPVEGVQYTLETQSKVARKTTRISLSAVGHDTGAMPQAATGWTTSSATMDRTVTINGVGAGGAGGEMHTFTFTTGTSESKPAKVEKLGTQIIEGVSAEGTRTTITIPAGQIGNEQQINIVSERWVSPELQVAVMTSHSDPRTGTTTYKLTNISRSEPAPTLFQVPADYTLKSVGGELRIKHDQFDEHEQR